MPSRSTLFHSLHDVGGAAWFGGALMGAVALNGATRNVRDDERPLAVAVSGWGRWSPVAAAAVGAHLIGGLGLLLQNRGRVKHQEGVTATTVAKTILTGAALATTAYSGLLGAHLAQDGDAAADAATVPTAGTPDRIASTQQQLRVLQWVTPALTGALIVLAAAQSEQHTPAAVVKGAAAKALHRARS